MDKVFFILTPLAPKKGVHHIEEARCLMKDRAKGGGTGSCLPMELPSDGGQQRALPAAHLSYDAHQDTLQKSHK